MMTDDEIEAFLAATLHLTPAAFRIAFAKKVAKISGMSFKDAVALVKQVADEAIAQKEGPL